MTNQGNQTLQQPVMLRCILRDDGIIRQGQFLINHALMQQPDNVQQLRAAIQKGHDFRQRGRLEQRAGHDIRLHQQGLLPLGQFQWHSDTAVQVGSNSPPRVIRQLRSGKIFQKDQPRIWVQRVLHQDIHDLLLRIGGNVLLMGLAGFNQAV